MKKRILYTGSTVLLCFLLVEGILRLLGFEGMQEPEYHIVSTPKECIMPDSQMAMALNPGEFIVNLNGGLIYSVTHKSNGSRKTSEFSESQPSERPRIHIQGCSYTYGYGVSDSLSLPFLIQSEFPQYQIENFAVPGYGEVQSLLQTRAQIKGGNPPQHIILGYNDFHKNRNTLNNAFRKQFYFGKSQQESNDYFLNRPRAWNYPYALLIGDTIQVKFQNCWEMYSPLPGAKYLAVMNLLEMVRMRSSLDPEMDLLVTQKVLLAIDKLCKTNNIRFTIAAMSGYDELRGFCEDSTIELINMEVDLNREGYRNTPFDYHPSPKAHKEYARLIRPFFVPDGVLKTKE